MASSLMIFQSFRSLFTDSFHVKFDLPRPLLTLSTRFILQYRPNKGKTRGLYE
uniref:Uncharacterized protein n=1 Tax=Arundo donax TaxID=35708 RepID=A0A0A9EI24_ARUDO